MRASHRPTREELQAAVNGIVEDVLAPSLDVLFVGINPGLYSAAVGHHFARPGNRFWPSLHQAGFTPRQFSPFEEKSLLELKLGITNIAARASARADELTDKELQDGAILLTEKIRRYRPRIVAILGITAYRKGFQVPEAKMGRQPARLVDSIQWILPNPSGLNAHYSLAGLVSAFAEVRAFLDESVSNQGVSS